MGIQLKFTNNVWCWSSFDGVAYARAREEDDCGRGSAGCNWAVLACDAEREPALHVWLAGCGRRGEPCGGRAGPDASCTRQPGQGSGCRGGRPRRRRQDPRPPRDNGRLSPRQRGLRPVLPRKPPRTLLLCSQGPPSRRKGRDRSCCRACRVNANPRGTVWTVYIYACVCDVCVWVGVGVGVNVWEWGECVWWMDG